MAEDRREQRRQPRPRFQQAEDVDRARQPLEQDIQPQQGRGGVRRSGQRRHQHGQDRLQRRPRRRAAQRGIAPCPPPCDPRGGLARSLAIGREPCRLEPIGQRLRLVRQPRRLPVVERIINTPGGRHRFAQQFDQVGPVRQPMKPRHPVQRLAGRQRVRLPIVHHLNAMLDRAQQGIGSGERSSLVGANPARPGERRQGIARRGCPQRRIAPAMDQLMDLREELRLADTAPPPLQVVAGAEALTARIMVADAPRQVADFADRAKVQPAPPHERSDRIEEIAAERLITSRHPGTDKRRPLPCQRLAFVIADRPFDRQRDRRRFGRWPQPQIDAQHIAVAIARLQQLDDTLGDPHRRLFRLLTRPVRQRFGIEQQDGIDVG